MRSTRRLLVALVAGVIAAGIFIVLLTQAYASRNSTNNNAPAVPTVSIVVASAPAGGTVPAGTKLTAQNVRLQAFPQTQFAAGQDLTDTKQAIGQFISVGLPDGAAILQSFLLSDAPSASNTVSRAPLPIDPGNEAIGIPFDPTKDVGGYIQPDDHLEHSLWLPQPGWCRSLRFSGRTCPSMKSQRNRRRHSSSRDDTAKGCNLGIPVLSGSPRYHSICFATRFRQQYTSPAGNSTGRE